MTEKNNLIIEYGLLLIVALISFLFLTKDYLPGKNNFSANTKINHDTAIKNEPKNYKPETVRGIYLTAASAGNENFRKNIIEQMKDSRINTVVIDIKDYSGYILYNSQISNLQDLGTVKAQMKDVKKIIDEFHSIDTYIIARQTVFQDPALARARPDLAFKTHAGNTWYDNSGLAWMDPAKPDVWQYNLDIAQEAIDLGFDEINFDYMRYPSDGNIGNLVYNIPTGESKASMLEKFFIYLSEELSNKAPISIDTFGLVMDNTNTGYDLGIGQKLVEIADHFDYVSPMMYPSHYPLNYLGFANLAEHPGPVISHGLKISYDAIKNKRAKIRPWLQAFNIGAVYDSAKIEAQVEATENATSTDGWLLWNARNYYPAYIFDN